jgi:hypothetical protein
VLIRVAKNGEGIKDRVFKKKKQAMKAWKRMEKQNICAILTHNDKIIEDNFKPDRPKSVQRVTFLIGCAYGKGLIEDLGPLEDGGKISILEDDFDTNDD